IPAAPAGRTTNQRNRGADRRSGAGTAVVMTTTKVVKTRRGKKTPPSSLPRRYVWPGRIPSVSYRTYPDFRANSEGLRVRNKELRTYRTRGSTERLKKNI